MQSKVKKSVEGLVPPQSLEIEAAVLGAVLIDENALMDCFSVFYNENVFYAEQHRLTFIAVKNLFLQNLPVDVLSVSQELKRLETLEKVGGYEFLVLLTNKISSGAHTEYHCRILMQYFLKREIIKFNFNITLKAYDDSVDVFDLISQWSREFDNVSDLINVGRNSGSFKSSLNELKFTVEFLSNKQEEVKLVGLDTGFTRINKYTGGFRLQDLIIIGGRPGMGKTAYVLKIVLENIKKNKPVGFISGEMSLTQLTTRLVSINSNFHLNQLMKNGFEKPEYFVSLQRCIDALQDLPLFVDDTGKMDISDVTITAKNWHRKYGIKVLVIDYLQLMKDRTFQKNNRSEELMEVSRRLKLLAKELQIVVIALVQVNRECEKRAANKRPLISDIKDCGAIEQDADMIQFIYRPDYYSMEMIEDDYDSQEQKRLISLGANTEIIFAKYRAGALGTALIKWIADKTKFVDVDDDFNSLKTEDFIPNMEPNDVF